AEQNQADLEVRLAAAESEEPRTEADAEGVDLDVEEASDQIVTELVEQDHHPDQNQEPPEILQKRDHLPVTLLTIVYVRAATPVGTFSPQRAPITATTCLATRRDSRSSSNNSVTEVSFRTGTCSKHSATVAAMP